MAKPQFSSSLKFYQKLYGDTHFYPYIASDWIFSRGWFSMGMAYKFGFFRATGVAAERTAVDFPTEADLTKTSDRTSLTLVPIDVMFLSRLALWGQNTLFLSGRLGWQEMYYQEMRVSENVVSEVGATSSKRTLATGWNGGVVVNLAIDYNLSQFDRESASSLRTMGLASVYLSPFVEVVSRVPQSLLGKSGKTNFSRTNVGVSILFESL